MLSKSTFIQKCEKFAVIPIHWPESRIFVFFIKEFLLKGCQNRSIFARDGQERDL